VLVGFRDAATGTIVPPRRAYSGRNGLARVAELTPPEFAPVADEGRVAEIVKAAEALNASGRKSDAWAALEFGLRRAGEDPLKARFREAMVRLGDLPPRPLTEVERRIVDDRIEDERRRYLRQQAGRLRDQGKLHAALRVLESIGGKLQEAADAAVVGALNDAKRAEKDLQDLREEIWDRATAEEKAEADLLVKDASKPAAAKAALDKAHSWWKERKFGPARRALRVLSFTAPKEVASVAAQDVKKLQAEWLAAISPEEQNLADTALRHPSFARTSVSLSHSFIFIGPKGLVDTIPTASRAQFDLAYVFLTDLFGRRPNPAGDRVTVYFKELWDFGGGVGGGKIIDLGNAPPQATNVRVDTGLLFHELTHCIDDTKPIHAGWREGLADFGAAYAHEALGRTQEAQGSFSGALAAFRKDYLERDLEYWRMPNYAVSAGFLLSFSEKYARAPWGHDWKGWRRFFREFRATPVRDGREPTLCRTVAHHLVRAFGPKAFDDLVQYRFPLVPSDRDAIVREAEKFEAGEDAVASSGPEFEEFPNSPMRRDLAARQALGAQRMNDEGAARRIAKEELGVVFDWRVVGPFDPDGADPGAQIFPPEREIDFAKEYQEKRNVAKWRIAGEPGPVEIDAIGWVTIKYAYMDDTATYALTHLSVPADTDAFAYVRSDDDFTLFVNDQRIDGYHDRGWNDSTPLRWRGPVEHVPDAMRLAVRLRAGRNKVLLKIRNRGGPAGFVAAFAQRDGRPIAGLASDADPPAPAAVVANGAGGAKPPKPAPEPKWDSVAKLDFRTKAAMKHVEVAAGGFDVKDKALAGTSTGKGVAWRKYTVRPGFPKDSPSNLLWLRSALTDGLEDFRLTIRLAPQKNEAPKIAVTFEGEGGNDGLSGQNVLFWNSGGKVAGQIERYEDLQIQWGPQVFLPETKDKDGEKKADREKEDAPRVLVLTWLAQRLTVKLDEATLVDAAPLRSIPGRRRIGLATWGADPKIAEIELETVTPK
jgi:hypothetical protein